MAELAFHSAAELFPLLAGEEFKALVEDIKARGQLEPIYVVGGQIVDGRNRYRACRELGIKPKTLSAPAWAFKNPEAFVLSENLHRRHLDAEARSRIATLLRSKGESYRAIGEKLGVSHETARAAVERAPVKNLTPAGKPHTPVTGRDGKHYPAARRQPASSPNPGTAAPSTKKKSPVRTPEKFPPLRPPCDGMQYAEMAVLDLEKIRPDDVQRAEALQFVRRWIDGHS